MDTRGRREFTCGLDFEYPYNRTLLQVNLNIQSGDVLCYIRTSEDTETWHKLVLVRVV